MEFELKLWEKVVQHFERYSEEDIYHKMRIENSRIRSALAAAIRSKEFPVYFMANFLKMYLEEIQVLQTRLQKIPNGEKKDAAMGSLDNLFDNLKGLYSSFPPITRIEFYDDDYDIRIAPKGFLVFRMEIDASRDFDFLIEHTEAVLARVENPDDQIAIIQGIIGYRKMPTWLYPSTGIWNKNQYEKEFQEWLECRVDQIGLKRRRIPIKFSPRKLGLFFWLLHKLKWIPRLEQKELAEILSRNFECIDNVNVKGKISDLILMAMKDPDRRNSKAVLSILRRMITALDKTSTSNGRPSNVNRLPKYPRKPQ